MKPVFLIYVNWIYLKPCFVRFEKAMEILTTIYLASTDCMCGLSSGKVEVKSILSSGNVKVKSILWTANNVVSDLSQLLWRYRMEVRHTSNQ